MEIPRPPTGDRGYALLVDADGAAEADIVESLVEILTQAGPVPVRRLHGNMHGQAVGKAWENLARARGFERSHRPRVAGTKNGADIALAIDALDLAAQGMRFFCLVAGDTDFGPLLERLHRFDCTVIVVSSNAALNPWSRFPFSFAEVRARAKALHEAKEASLGKNDSKPATSASTPPVPASWRGVEELLQRVIVEASRRGHVDEAGWVDADRLGTLFNVVDKEYSREKYGLSKNTTVRSMASRYPSRFEIALRTTKQGRHTFLRIRKA